MVQPFLAAWRRWWNTSGRSADKPRGRDVTPGRLEGWAQGNFMEFNKEKCGVLSLRTQHQYKWGLPDWVPALLERTWRFGGHHMKQ